MVVVDSSSLILLAKISILDKVLKNSKKKLTVTQEVYKESTFKQETFDAKLITKRFEESLIHKKEIKNVGLYNKIRKDFNLGKGEAESVVLCLESEKGLITDDRKAINTCKILKIKFTTAPNLLVRLYKNGLITKNESESYIEKLEKYGRYSATIINKAKEDVKNGKNG